MLPSVLKGLDFSILAQVLLRTDFHETKTASEKVQHTDFYEAKRRIDDMDLHRKSTRIQLE